MKIKSLSLKCVGPFATQVGHGMLLNVVTNNYIKKNIPCPTCVFKERNQTTTSVAIAYLHIFNLIISFCMQFSSFLDCHTIIDKLMKIGAMYYHYDQLIKEWPICRLSYQTD